MPSDASEAEDLAAKQSRRCQTSLRLGVKLASLSHARLSVLLDPASSPAGTNWGRHQCLSLGKDRVFVKRIPITEREVAEPFTTRNLYQLPMNYHYGLGSTGFGAWRELICHLKASQWVQSGLHMNFPLLHHYRIVPMDTAPIDRKAHRDLLANWGGNKAIGNYLSDRAQARHELQLYLEYLPHTLKDWLYAHQAQTERVLASLQATLGFLRGQGMLHLDAHQLNVLSDGESFYLSDFGLALDRHFELEADERDFFARHRDYDAAQVLWSLCYVVRQAYEALSPTARQRLHQRFTLPPVAHSREVFAALLDRIEAIHAEQALGLDDAFVAQLLRFREVVGEKQAFFSAMQASSQKDVPYRGSRMHRLLKVSGWLGQAQVRVAKGLDMPGICAYTASARVSRV